jgi:hypothetical protein
MTGTLGGGLGLAAPSAKCRPRPGLRLCPLPQHRAGLSIYERRRYRADGLTRPLQSFQDHSQTPDDWTPTATRFRRPTREGRGRRRVILTAHPRAWSLPTLESAPASPHRADRPSRWEISGVRKPMSASRGCAPVARPSLPEMGGSQRMRADEPRQRRTPAIPLFTRDRRRFGESGRWDSNPRHLAWEASALPAELRPREAYRF